MEWVAEEVICESEIYQVGSVQGPEELKRGESAFGRLTVVDEGEVGSVEAEAFEGGWSTLTGEDHSGAEAKLNALLQVVKRAVPPVNYITDSSLVV